MFTHPVASARHVGVNLIVNIGKFCEERKKEKKKKNTWVIRIFFTAMCLFDWNLRGFLSYALVSEQILLMGTSKWVG